MITSSAVVGLRAAQAALDAARPAMGRLDHSRSADDIAADLLETWEGVERALRALCATPILSGQSLIREASQRQVLTLDQAHALVEFSASCERARESSYEPTAADVQNAHVAFQQMEALLASPVLYSAPVETPSHHEAVPSASPTPTSVDAAALAPRANLAGRVLVSLAVVALLGASGFVAWRYFMSADAAMRNGVAALQAGRRSEATHQFDLAVERDPAMALPHVYAGRIYREDGNLESAAIELRRAIELEPRNALALREMASYLLARGDYDLARAFYVRALGVNPEDRLALGYLACALARLGRVDEAQRFHQRAGSGAWSSCAAPPPAPASVLPR